MIHLNLTLFFLQTFIIKTVHIPANLMFSDKPGSPLLQNKKRQIITTIVSHVLVTILIIEKKLL